MAYARSPARAALAAPILAAPILAAILGASGCGHGSTPPPTATAHADGPGPAGTGRATWDRSARQGAVEECLDERKELVRGNPPKTELVSGYEAFATGPVGAIGAEMVPVILFRILPDLAKKYDEKDKEGDPLFGEPEENFAKFGFWADPRPRFEGRPLPMGFAWTPGHEGDTPPLSLTVRTCGSCHTGRVRLDDGSIRILVGAPNTEILLHQYDTALAGFLYGHVADDDKKARFARDIRALVDEKHTDPNFFFKGARGYDAQEEARQVAVFKAALELPAKQGGILELIKQSSGLKLKGVKTLEAVAYGKANSPRLDDGPPGLIDSSGLGIAAFVGPAGLDPKAALFAGATKNDVPAVWNQRTRKQWQWDGNIRDVLARNLVAALGLVGLPEKMDITANVIVSDFIDCLPPAPYPFAVDEGKIALGREVYERNCLACHRPDQRRGDGRPLPVFNDLGTDMNRAKVVTPAGYEVIKHALVACYQPEGLRFTYGGKVRTPNEGIVGDDLLVRRFRPEDQGYVAGPLDGLWARAPYLHNGSVPTLRHLLVPSLRGEAQLFVRGSISYDTRNVGWAWEADRLDRLREDDPSARIFDAREDGQSNAGHDQAEWVDADGKVGPKGRRYRLAWDDPADPAVEALLEYLKTF